MHRPSRTGPLAFALLALALMALPVALGTAEDEKAEGSREEAAEPDAEEEEEKREVVLDTVYDDRRVGEEESEKVGAAMGLVENRPLVAYVSAIGKRLARHAPRHRFDYRFRIVDQDLPNAFALPGGFIYVSRGLLALANSEDELANVIGHEIAHVAARHAAARLQVTQAMPGIVRFLSRGSLAGYSRSQEREADRLGQGIAALAGYDPEGMATFLRGLEFTERLRLGASRWPSFLDTHPAAGRRAADASQRARGIAWKPKPGVAKSREDFLRRIEGLVVGVSGAEGVFQGGRFLHADLGFTLRFPDNWETANTHTAVGAVSPDRRAQVILEHAGQGSDLMEAVDEFRKETEALGVRFENPQPIKVGGFEALRMHGRASNRFAGVRLVVTFIASRGHRYRLTGVSRENHERNEAIFVSTARSFRPLSRELAGSIRENRLQVVEARAGESLPELSDRTGNAWPLQHTAVMNDLFATDALEAGQLVKVAISKPYRAAK